jgi:O-antigen ligase
MQLALDQRLRLPGIALLAALCGVALAAGGLTAFYLCASLLGCAFILADFRCGVVLLILLMPLSGSSTLFPHEMFGITGLNPLNLLLAGTCGSWLLYAGSGGRAARFVPRWPLLVLYVLPILVAGAIGTQHIHEVAPILLTRYQGLDFPNAASYLQEMTFKPLLMVLFALLVAAAVARSERPVRWLLPAVLSMFAMAAIVPVYVQESGIGLQTLASSDEREFLSALGLHANDLGRLYASSCALLLFTWAEARGLASRWVLLPVAALCLVALVLTFSRGAIVELGVISVLYVVWRRSGRTLLFAGVAVAAVLVLAPEALFQRLETGEGGGIDAISAGRVDGLWLPLLPEVLQHPLFGNGTNSILWSEAMRAGGGQQVLPVTHPHNAYLQALLDSGIIGTLMLCAYFVHVLRGLWGLSKDPRVEPALRGLFQGAAAALIGMLVSDFTDSSLAPRPEQAFLWLAIGMMYGEYARRSSA